MVKILNKKIYKSKSKFFFSVKSIGILVFSKSFSNIFITLLDLKRRLIIVKTSGSSHVGFSKRKKISPNAVEFIVKKLFFYLKFYKILNLKIIFKTRVSTHTYNFVKLLLKRGFRILTIESRKRVPHNGCRQRKIRRR